MFRQGALRKRRQRAVEKTPTLVVFNGLLNGKSVRSP